MHYLGMQFLLVTAMARMYDDILPRKDTDAINGIAIVPIPGGYILFSVISYSFIRPIAILISSCIQSQQRLFLKNLYTHKSLVVLLASLFEAVRRFDNSRAKSTC